MIKDNLSTILSTLPVGVKLVAVSKFHPSASIMEAYNAGQRIFGENRPQEMASKASELPKDIEWHQIGHLQTNKVRLIAPFVSMIESVDSLKLASIISQEAERIGRRIDILLQLHVAQEQTKFGWSEDELIESLTNNELQSLQGIRIVGLMTMATFTDNMDQVRSEFESAHNIYQRIKSEYLPEINTLSMGMSGDYELAIECGSNMVRVGSSIFGNRSY